MGIRSGARAIGSGFFFLLVGLLPSVGLAEGAGLCGAGEKLSEREKAWLIESVRHSEAGKRLLEDFRGKFESFDRLHVYWDDVSYSQLDSGGKRASSKRADAQEAVCVHLAKRLPEIEHIADFAHEITHATRLTADVLHGRASTAEEFVEARLGAHGGEADAFAMECRVKRDILGKWDELCMPYTSLSIETRAMDMDAQKILAALRDGTLSASLTGEPYPTMLTRQFEALQQRLIQRAPASSREK